MSGSIEDKDFEQYLQRKSPVSEHYHSLDGIEPPPDLDEKILAKAAAEVRSPLAEKSRAWKKWSVPVALAASTVIAVSIVLESGVRHEITTSNAPSVVHSERTVAEPATPDAIEPAAPAMNQTPATERATRGDDQKVVDVDIAPRPAFAPQVEVPDAQMQALAKKAEQKAEETERAPDVIDSVAEERVAETAVESSSQRSPTPASQYATVSSRRAVAPPPAAVRDLDHAADATAVASAAPAQYTHDPKAWLAHIRNLREQGDDVQADTAWKLFEAAFPDFAVAEDDLARPKK